MRRLQLYLFAAAILTMSVPTAVHLASAMPAQNHVSAQGTVRAYFEALNAGMQTGNFDAVGELYAEDATLTQSNPAGVTSVFQGREQILGFYRSFYAKFPGLQFRQDAMHSLANDVVLSYETAGTPTQSAPGRCMHVFRVRTGL